MSGNKQTKTIYKSDVLEFVTVGVEYCAFLEKSDGRPRMDFINTLLKLLPLLYIKALLLPCVESNGDFLPQGKVTEEDYDYIRSIVYDQLGDNDEYLDMSYEYGMETDETQWKSVSEHLADIYQPVRNFLAVYEDGVEDCMADALWTVRDNFELYWGEALVAALRRLHKIRYSNSPEDETEYDD